MTPEEREVIKKLELCDFSQMHQYYLEQAAERKNRTKEEKEVRLALFFCVITQHEHNIVILNNKLYILLYQVVLLACRDHCYENMRCFRNGDSHFGLHICRRRMGYVSIMTRLGLYPTKLSDVCCNMPNKSCNFNFCCTLDISRSVYFLFFVYCSQCVSIHECDITTVLISKCNLLHQTTLGVTHANLARCCLKT